MASIIIPKRKIYYPRVKGKIQAWLIDNETGCINVVHVKDYLSYKENLTPNQYLYDLASLGTGSTPDMEFKYVALSTAYDPPDKQSTLILEKSRNEPLSVTRVNNKVIIEGKFESDSSTVVANISSVTSTTVFAVNSATGLNIGDRISCQVAGSSTYEQRKISDISTNTITVHAAFSGLPVVGTANCKQMFSRLHLVYGASATGTPNSGSGASIAILITAKLSTQTLYTRHEMEYIGV